MRRPATAAGVRTRTTPVRPRPPVHTRASHPRSRRTLQRGVRRPTHLRMLLAAADSTGDLDAQADALLALLDVDYLAYQLDTCGQTIQSLAAAWDSLAHKLCGR